MTGTTTSDIKYICTPLPSTPNGKEWEAFEERFLNALSTKVDDRGWSGADHVQGIDEGGTQHAVHLRLVGVLELQVGFEPIP